MPCHDLSLSFRVIKYGAIKAKEVRSEVLSAYARKKIFVSDIKFHVIAVGKHEGRT